MPRPLPLVLTLTCATLLLSFYLWRPLLGDHVLGPPTPAPPPLPPSTENLYAAPVPPRDFDHAPLADTLDHLRQTTGKSIFVNWRALEAAGIHKDAPITLHTPPARLDQSLRHLLDHLESTHHDTRLDFTEDAGVLTISTYDDLARNTSTRVYDVRDLVQLDFRKASTATPVPSTWPRPPIPRFRPNALYSRWPIDTLLVPGPRDATGRTTALCDDIRHSIDPASWRELGGTVGGIRPFNGQLIVTTTDLNQVHVAHLLEHHRWHLGLAALAARTLALLLPVMTLTSLTLLISRHLRLRRRKHQGLCTNCGYDLRASPTQCPECGHTPVPA